MQKTDIIESFDVSNSSGHVQFEESFGHARATNKLKYEMVLERVFWIILQTGSTVCDYTTNMTSSKTKLETI
uniref:Uncharacterized protein n=1 Tax=Romanomermis culicivorax TaxID=13658 RepID=A0A915K532_ROMCU